MCGITERKKKNNCGNNSRVKNYFLESISKIFVRNISCTKAWEEVWYRWDIYPSLGLNHHTLITALISSLTPRLPRCVALNIITVAINVNNVSEIIITTGAAAQLKKNKKKTLITHVHFCLVPKQFTHWCRRRRRRRHSVRVDTSDSSARTVTSWYWSLMDGPVDGGRLLISRMVLRRTPSRLSTMSSTSSDTTGSCSAERKHTHTQKYPMKNTLHEQKKRREKLWC